jgi:hypothetical protein
VGTEANSGSARNRSRSWEGQHLGLHEEVHVVGPQVLHRRQVQRLEEVQHLEHGDPLGRGRRLVDGNAPVVPGQWRSPGGALAREIALGHEAAVGARVPRDLAGDLALVELGAAGRGDRLERPRQVRVPQPLLRPGRAPAREKDGRSLPVPREEIGGLLRPARQARGDGEALSGELNRGLEILLER